LKNGGISGAKNKEFFDKRLKSIRNLNGGSKLILREEEDQMMKKREKISNVHLRHSLK
jgi:hypothetical protein